jgi:hypothetical protein
LQNIGAIVKPCCNSSQPRSSNLDASPKLDTKSLSRQRCKISKNDIKSWPYPVSLNLCNLQVTVRLKLKVIYHTIGCQTFKNSRIWLPSDSYRRAEPLRTDSAHSARHCSEPHSFLPSRKEDKQARNTNESTHSDAKAQHTRCFTSSSTTNLQ